MSAEIKREVDRLRNLQHTLWLERGDLPFADGDRRTALTEQIRQLHRQIEDLEDQYYDKLEEEEEEAARQQSFRFIRGKKRRRQ